MLTQDLITVLLQ